MLIPVYDEIKRVQKATDYIEKNLGNTLDVDRVASVSGYSVSHFYRLFFSLAGCNIGEYVRLRKLAVAMGECIKEGRSLIDVSLDYGYGSQEAFTRAFKNAFGVTPGFAGLKRINAEILYPRIDVIDNYGKLDISEIESMMKFPAKTVSELRPFDVIEYSIKDYKLDVEHPNSIAKEKPDSVSYIVSCGTPDYPNRYWISTDCDSTEDENAKRFIGGLYTSLSVDAVNARVGWKHIVNWAKLSKYEIRDYKEWLERIETKDKSTLLLPVEETTRRYVMSVTDEFADVELVKLKDMRVAWYRSVGESPENATWNVLGKWAKRKGLFDVPETRVFGFNNPCPNRNEPLYGYEFQITIPDDYTSVDCHPFGIKTITAGDYGQLKFPFSDMGNAWSKIIRWRKMM